MNVQCERLDFTLAFGNVLFSAFILYKDFCNLYLEVDNSNCYFIFAHACSHSLLAAWTFCFSGILDKWIRYNTCCMHYLYLKCKSSILTYLAPMLGFLYFFDILLQDCNRRRYTLEDICLRILYQIFRADRTHSFCRKILANRLHIWMTILEAHTCMNVKRRLIITSISEILFCEIF